MDFKEHFIHLFIYIDWATKESVKSIKKLDDPSDRLLTIISHIVATEQLWYDRVTQAKIPISPWEKYSLDECITQSSIITSKWIRLLEERGEEGLSEIITYLNTKGDKFKNSLMDIVFHTINHSSYHRAQVALLVRDAGGEPALTDYIVYARSVAGN
ncbi:MAG: DinB family protein [Ignavibacteriaceae bacterium]